MKFTKRAVEYTTLEFEDPCLKRLVLDYLNKHYGVDHFTSCEVQMKGPVLVDIKNVYND